MDLIFLDLLWLVEFEVQLISTEVTDAAHLPGGRMMINPIVQAALTILHAAVKRGVRPPRTRALAHCHQSSSAAE
jgi:hypothetical protein